MSDKKRSAKRKWKNALLAAALTASVILALPAWSVGSAEARVPEQPSKELELEGGQIAQSRLTIRRAGTNPEKQGAITVDLYKVANAEKETNYDGYTLTVPTDNTFDSVESLVSAANGMRDAELTPEKREGYYNTYLDLAQQVARDMLAVPNDSPDGSNDVAGQDKLGATKDITGQGDITFDEELDAGLYLVIAHGRDLTPAEYKGETAEGKLITMAYNNGYTYSYQPMLIALPMRGTQENGVFLQNNGVFSTAQSEGDWQYTVTAELKAEEEVQRVPLQITKTFTNAADALVSGKNGCVFKIEAELNGRKVYSNVVEAEFDEAKVVSGQQIVVLDAAAAIPVGATVTVTEVYDGAAFTGEGAGDDQFVVKPAEVTLDDAGNVTGYAVSFTNRYNNRDTGGDIVTNSFSKKADGSYGWNDPRPAATPDNPNND